MCGTPPLGVTNSASTRQALGFMSKKKIDADRKSSIGTLQMALAIAFALATVSCGGGGESAAQPTPPPPPPPTDSQAPQAALSAPASGATVSGSLSVSATASDNVGVVGVQFKLDGVNLGTEDTSTPYEVTWDSTTASNGAHSLTAVARDAAGNSVTSAVLALTVDNSDAISPTVSFTSPDSGATVTGAVSVAANAADNVGVVGVQFTLDGNALGAEDLTAPYTYAWATTGTTNGSHQLSATARDAAGRTATATLSVTVSNAAGTALTINGNQRFQTIDGFGISANSASWDNGELRPAIDKLIDENGSTIWRVVIEMADWEATNDDADPNNFNWTYYNTIYSSPRFEELWATIAYLNQKGRHEPADAQLHGPGPHVVGRCGICRLQWKTSGWRRSLQSRTTPATTGNSSSGSLHLTMNPTGTASRRHPGWTPRNMRESCANWRRPSSMRERDRRPSFHRARYSIHLATASIDYLPALMAEPAVMAKTGPLRPPRLRRRHSAGADSAIRNSAYPRQEFLDDGTFPHRTRVLQHFARRFRGVDVGWLRFGLQPRNSCGTRLQPTERCRQWSRAACVQHVDSSLYTAQAVLRVRDSSSSSFPREVCAVAATESNASVHDFRVPSRRDEPRDARQPEPWAAATSPSRAASKICQR